MMTAEQFLAMQHERKKFQRMMINDDSDEQLKALKPSDFIKIQMEEQDRRRNERQTQY